MSLKVQKAGKWKCFSSNVLRQSRRLWLLVLAGFFLMWTSRKRYKWGGRVFQREIWHFLRETIQNSRQSHLYKTCTLHILLTRKSVAVKLDAVICKPEWRLANSSRIAGIWFLPLAGTVYFDGCYSCWSDRDSCTCVYNSWCYQWLNVKSSKTLWLYTAVSSTHRVTGQWAIIMFWDWEPGMVTARSASDPWHCI